ncbi:Protein of unknown function [Pseudomonas chlororaphis]|uniref:DUF2946 domain-containing protein n=1 Tax=Pseudomonas chlororaphis TaxID=587753 RepID=UPI00087C7D28|nr:DUF2946 domain-containing protein [Pseudomonas chlororaphis]AZD47924.1 hypothetical protein C4K20_2509 [Pseudomonas chlororaphis subsp. aurantiaca]AZD66377.1 hypothetical protein C4K17_2491 [Pseudomonas chlororaphis subsp. aurantiaca]QIT22453.1 DUF2946 domain-containing protein [Pseudomonas chlororaphis subsp. aurantiaca]WDH06616.1 DUF2946 domain-containing protein [Pseudomonas chlororaphis]WDH10630.1 DUF2946 domain-containing protein [Pseudomonas chlororaphis]
MKFARTDRSLIAWMLYCCVLFNVFACSIGHGQMVGQQLNGIGGQFCTVDPSTQAPASSNPVDESLPTLSKAFGCPLCSTGGMGPAFNSSLTLAILPQHHSPPLAPRATADIPTRFTWPAAHPRAPPAFA